MTNSHVNEIALQFQTSPVAARHLISAYPRWWTFEEKADTYGVGRRARDQQEKFMNFSGLFARIVALIGAAALRWRRMQGAAPKPAWGNAPAIPAAKPQGALPTLKMPTAQGWSEGERPTAAPGLRVNAFATDLDHPRWINVLPNRSEERRVGKECRARWSRKQ